MHLQWTPEQRATRALFHDIGARSTLDRPRPGAFDTETWRLLGEAGLWRLIVPKEHGGDGAGWWAFTAALEGLAASGRAPGLLLSVIAQAGLVRALERHGTSAQRVRFFPRLLAGELGATGIADPDTGTDVRSTSTLLTAQANETFRLDGAKYNIAHAPECGFMLVVCKLAGEGREGISLVLIDADLPGIRVGAPDAKLGNHDLPTSWITFDDVRLDYGHLLGEAGRGLRNLIDIVSLGRIYYGLVAAWCLEPMLARAVDYATDRETFGVPILDHQHVQRRLVDIRIGMEAARWTSYAALDRLLRGEDEAVMLCSVAKILGADSAVAGALHLLRLYGSKGYQAGEVSDFLRDALAFCSVGGTDEMHRRNIVNQMTRLHRRAEVPAARSTVPPLLRPAPAPLAAAGD